jgi:hypothetical protein
MKAPFARMLSFVVGLIAGSIAIALPLLFISNELQEAESAKQYGGHPLLGSVAAVLTGLVFAGFAGFVAYLRFQGRKIKLTCCGQLVSALHSQFLHCLFPLFCRFFSVRPAPSVVKSF